jgi:lambda repressor-like predicted transcriptional regulator
MLKASKIRSLIVEAGTSGAEIGRSLGFTRSYVSHVIKGRSKNRVVREAIAAAIGKRVSEIWPEENTKKRAA